MQENSFHDDHDLTVDLVSELIKERRAERRWKNIRFFIGFLLILFLALLFFSQVTGPRLSEEDGKDYVSLIRLEGMIAPGEDFSAEQVVPVLKDAFKDKEAKGVILVINSGGGTPVQASIIHDMLVQLKNKYKKKVIVVGEDILASGAYYVAVGADKIYVNPNTITGSIGVILKGFGFNDLIKKIGVERRVYTSGENKDRLDPFLPQNQQDTDKIKQLMSEVHDNFNQVVIRDRQGKLQAPPSELFTGDFWSGQTALKLGLVDGLGNLYSVMQSEFNVSRFKDYSATQNVLKALLGQVSTALDLPLGHHERVQMLYRGA